MLGATVRQWRPTCGFCRDNVGESLIFKVSLLLDASWSVKETFWPTTFSFHWLAVVHRLRMGSTGLRGTYLESPHHLPKYTKTYLRTHLAVVLPGVGMQRLQFRGTLAQRLRNHQQVVGTTDRWWWWRPWKQRVYELGKVLVRPICITWYHPG